MRTCSCPGALGVAATTPASVLVAAITGAEPVAVVGRGSGIDDETWMRKAAAVRDALRRARPYVRDPQALLRVAGGADLAVLAGFLVQAALRRTPVLLDGLVVGAAALVADELAPGAREWWLLAQRSPEPAMALAAAHLELTPLLDLGVRTDDATGALAALPLVTMAARLLAETATAADSGIAPVRTASHAAEVSRSAADAGVRAAGPRTGAELADDPAGARRQQGRRGRGGRRAALGAGGRDAARRGRGLAGRRPVGGRDALGGGGAAGRRRPRAGDARDARRRPGRHGGRPGLLRTAGAGARGDARRRRRTVRGRHAAGDAGGTGGGPRVPDGGTGRGVHGPGRGDRARGLRVVRPARRAGRPRDRARRGRRGSQPPWVAPVWWLALAAAGLGVVSPGRGRARSRSPSRQRWWSACRPTPAAGSAA